MTIDIAKCAELIEDVGQTVVLPYFRNLDADDVVEKTGATDLVTKADIEAEQALSKALKAIDPEAAIVGEEGVFENPQLLEGLKHKSAWIIDPVDGTNNFAKGNAHFGMILAYVVNGQTQAGWIYDVPNNRMLMGEKGCGVTFCGENLGPYPAGSGEPHGIVGRYIRKFKSRFDHVKWLGSAAHGYLQQVTGEVGFSFYKPDVLKPWDHAAGVMLHSERGGVNTLLSGDQYQPAMLADGLLLANDEHTLNALLEKIKNFI